MAVVAWVSRHAPLTSQIVQLRKHFGDFKLEIIGDTFRDAKDIIRTVKDIRAKVAVVVAPLSMIAVLLKEAPEIAWLRAEMEAVHMCRGPEYCEQFAEGTDVWLPLHGSRWGRHMRFSHFCQLKEVRVICEPLEPKEERD